MKILRRIVPSVVALAVAGSLAMAGGIAQLPLNSAALDVVFGSTIGSGLCRLAAGWGLVPAGAAGQVLTVPAGGGCPVPATPGSGGNVSTSGTSATGQLAQFTSSTAIQGATAAQGLTSLGLNSAGQDTFRNRLINGGFTVNQRGYASGTALAATAYAHDRWKAGAAGGTYTFTATKPDTTVTITAGTLAQVIEDANVEGGTYTLSWTGTATARVYQGTAAGAYVASPLVMTGLSAGTNTTVEFGPGTLGRVQFEPGTTASAFERRPLATELELAQVYFNKTFPYGTTPASNTGNNGAFAVVGVSAGAGGVVVGGSFPRMRAIPTIVTYAPTTAGGSGMSGNNGTNPGAGIIGIGDSSAFFFNTTLGTPGVVYSIHMTMSAEL